MAAMNATVTAAREHMARLLPADADARARSEVDAFAKLLQRHMDECEQKIDWDRIAPPPADRIRPYASLAEPSPEQIGAALGKVAVLKLNGGLGTTMGCVGPKSVIEVRAGQTFLDLTITQIQVLNRKYGTRVPLILMNSFSTHDDTERIVKKYAGVEEVPILSFNQSRFPRIYKDTLMPVPTAYATNDEQWYPPGHGDVYESLRACGVMADLMARGIEYVFISNVDNLGATVDVKIASLLVTERLPFLMEVTNKTRADVKGGTLISYEGRTKLLEIAQVAKKNVDEFKSIKRFAVFNTNSLWANLGAVKAALEANTLTMDVIANNKAINGVPVIQLEQACGSAIQCFADSIAVNVPRSRFLPVKKTSDLLLVQSDLYALAEGTLTIAPARIGGAPAIKLGDPEFTKVSGYWARFASVPSILDLESLVVVGDVSFGAGVTLAGTVVIIAGPGERIEIPAGAVIENRIITNAINVEY